MSLINQLTWLNIIYLVLKNQCSIKTAHYLMLEDDVYTYSFKTNCNIDQVVSVLSFKYEICTYVE